MVLLPTALGLLLAAAAASGSLRQCGEDDFAFRYTECRQGERWRVAVPAKEGVCTGGQVPPPRKGKACSFTCPGGEYLELASEECRSCPAGSFSLDDGGQRFEQFDSQDLPEGFRVRNAPTARMRAWSESGSFECPKGGGWQIRDGWLTYVPTPCWSTLTYSAELVKKGQLEFVYKVPASLAPSLYLNVDAQNEQCQSYLDRYDDLLHGLKKGKGKGREDHTSAAQGWQIEQLQLRKGRNVISFRASSAFSSRSALKDAPPSDDAVTVYRMDITGLPYSTNCSQCPPGTYSTPGSKKCSPCAPDTYSAKASPNCKDCPKDEFSTARSSRCTPRPACKAGDYFAQLKPCDGKGMRQVEYHWIQPQICRQDMAASVKLPSSEQRKCTSCNPGMAKQDGSCEFCQNGTFSDGDSACAACPTNTRPNVGYQFANWDVLPRNFKSRCEVASEGEEFADCGISDTWLPAGARVHTAHIRRPGIVSVLEMHVAGFRSDQLGGRKADLSRPLAQLTFVFSTACRHPSCQFFFAVQRGEPGEEETADIVAVWNGTVGGEAGRVYKHPVTSDERTTFLWAFARSNIMSQGSPSDTLDWVDEEASLHSVNLTEAKDGGASACLPCPRHSSHSKDSCLPCPPGHFVHPDTHQCLRCPKGTVLNITTDLVGEKSCSACGLNMESSDGVHCEPKTKLSFAFKGQTHSYDLAKLFKGHFTTEGVKVFGREGSGYFHAFNFSLSPATPVLCYDSYAMMRAKENKDAAVASWAISSLVCRSTGIPWSPDEDDSAKASANHSHSANLYVSPIALGTRLLGITTQTSYDGITLPKRRAEEADAKSLEVEDVNLYFASETGPSVNCPRGPTSVVSLRCTPLQNQTKARLPKDCPDGTCDGCLYQLILESALACPVCGDSDFRLIKGECAGGQQTLHYIPQKHCVLSGQTKKSTTQHCVVFSRSVQLLSAAASALAVLLCCLLGHVWRRHRSLEYKYMKLVEGRVGPDGEAELPAAESCALDEDEEEEEDDGREDKVIFKRGGKKTSSQQWGPIRDGHDDADSFAYTNLLQQ